MVVVGVCFSVFALGIAWSLLDGSSRRCSLIISNVLYLCENLTLSRVLYVDLKNLSYSLEKLLLNELSCIKFIFSLSITERILFTICFISVLT